MVVFLTVLWGALAEMEELIFVNILDEQIDGKSGAKSRRAPTRGLEMIRDPFFEHVAQKCEGFSTMLRSWPSH